METLETLTKSNSTCGSTEFKDVITSNNDHKHHSNQHENSHKLQNKKGRPLLSLKESQWKLRQQHDQNFLWKKTTVEQILASEETNKSNEQGCESQRQ